LPSFDLNAVRFRPPLKGGHVESYFLKAADTAGERALWIRATIFAPLAGRALAEGWAIAFERRGGSPRSVAVKHTLPFEGASFGKSGLDIRWEVDGGPLPHDAMTMTAGATSGRAKSRDHSIAWDLRYSPCAPPIVPFPELLYTTPIPKVKTCTPTPDARFEGEVIIDGERWETSGWRGMQGHNWGRAHAERYAWCHASTWEGDDQFILEGMSGDLRIGKIPLPRATILCVRHRGIAYDFNRPLDLLRTRSDIGLRRWEFTAESGRARIEGAIDAGTDDFVGLYYPNPDGSMVYCLNASLAHARVRFEARGEPAIELASRAAALEIGTKDGRHGVKMVV
jgi:hypothetical protein